MSYLLPHFCSYTIGGWAFHCSDAARFACAMHKHSSLQQAIQGRSTTCSCRDGAESAEENQEYDEQGNRPPVARVHVDYTTQSGIDRLKALLPDEAERLLQTPFAVVQASSFTAVSAPMSCWHQASG